MSLIAFRNRFEDELHGFLWRQWSQLGVSVSEPGEDRWILDPEALLLFTLESARTEPRLFDEVLDWLLTNGERIDVQRLGNLKDADAAYPKLLLNAAASLLAEHETSAKWSRMATVSPEPAVKAVPLILLRPGTPMPSLRSHDPHFEKAGFLRSPFKARGLSKPTSLLASAACLRLRLRAFFGIGIRAEAMAYLVTHPESHADNVARAIGYSLPGVQQVLREMKDSGLIHARRAGREKRYWADKGKWSGFLDVNFGDPQCLAARSEAARRFAGEQESEESWRGGAMEWEARKAAGGKAKAVTGAPGPMTPMDKEARREAALPLLQPGVTWVNWARLFRGLARILRYLRTPAWETMTEYLRASEFARTLALAKDDLEAAELGFHLPSQEGASLDTHVLALERALKGLVR